MHEMKLIFEQTPPPHFCLKVVCKKGGHIFMNLRYISITSTELFWKIFKISQVCVAVCIVTSAQHE